MAHKYQKHWPSQSPVPRNTGLLFSQLCYTSTDIWEVFQFCKRPTSVTALPSSQHDTSGAGRACIQQTSCSVWVQLLIFQLQGFGCCIHLSWVVTLIHLQRLQQQAGSQNSANSINSPVCRNVGEVWGESGCCIIVSCFWICGSGSPQRVSVPILLSEAPVWQ